MNYKSYTLLLILIVFLFKFGAAQKKSSFGELEKLIENRIPRNQLPYNKGWKFEHRWLNEFKKRVNPKGQFYDGSVYFNEAEEVAKNQKGTQHTKLSGWIPVGPTQRADLSLTKGLGRINCITFHPTNPNTFWVGVAQGGVWKTSDGGSNWTPLTDDLPILRISDIAVDPSDTNIIYICVGDYAYMDVALNLDDRKRHTHYGLGVYKSTDGGTTWNPTGLTYQMTQLDGSLMRRVIINPNYPDSLISAGISGIWASANGGATWIQKNDSLIWDIEPDPNNPYTLFATTGYLKNSQQGTAGVMKSTDFGNTWTLLNTGIPPTDSVLRIEVEVAPSNSNHIYALACSNNKGFYGLYSSLDGGTTWTYSDAGGLNILEWYDGTGSGGQGTYDLSLMVHPTNENVVYSGGINIWGSTDGGATFNGVSIWYDIFGPGSGLHADQHQMKYNPLDNKFYICNDGGLVRTSNIQMGDWSTYNFPTNWEYISDGMQTSSFYSIGVSEFNSNNISGGAQDNSTYFNNNGNWSNLFGGDGMHTELHPTDPNTILGSSQYGRILHSSDGGLNYYQMEAPQNEDGEWVTPFMYEPGNTNLVYGGFGNLYSASPGTDFLTPLSNFPDMPGATVPAPISNFNIAQSNTSTMYLAKRIYHSYNQLSEFWATTNGQTWTNKTLGLPDSLYFTDVEIDDDNPLSVWVVAAGFETGKHIYHSVDGGTNWNNITYNLPNLPVNCIIHHDKSMYNTIYVGTDIGVYYSNDTLNAWVPHNQNLPNVIISDLNINYTDDVIYAATFGRGMWKTNLLNEKLVSIDDMEFQNVDIKLFPNPNSGEFNLKIDGMSAGNLAMEIIDIMGRSVVSENLIVADYFQRKLNYDLVHGMYFLKISKGKKMKTIRFIVK